MLQSVKEESSGRKLSFAEDKRKANFLSKPLLRTGTVQYSAASLSYTFTDERAPAAERQEGL